MLSMNKRLYLRAMLNSEQKYLSLMKEITKKYSLIVTNKNNQTSNHLMRAEFLSLVVGIICLILLVLEPAFKKGENNYKELQQAR